MTTIRQRLHRQLLITKFATWLTAVLVFLALFRFTANKPSPAWWAATIAVIFGVWLALRRSLRCPRCGAGLSKLAGDQVVTGEKCPTCGVNLDEPAREGD